jgi:CRP/FNR family transcriptional regulator, cyclic AMP receptor protein
VRLSRSKARTDERIRQLADVELFSACPDRELQLIARLSDEVAFAEGTVLMEEGRTGRECFVLLEGEAIVTIGHEAMAVIGPGDITGEMALIEHGPRSATVTAWSPVRALVFSTQEFDSVLDHVPAVAMRVMRALAQRLRAVQAA